MRPRFIHLLGFAFLWLKVGFKRAAAIYYAIGVALLYGTDVFTWSLGFFPLPKPFQATLLVGLMPAVMYGFYPDTWFRLRYRLAKMGPHRLRALHPISRVLVLASLTCFAGSMVATTLVVARSVRSATPSRPPELTPADYLAVVFRPDFPKDHLTVAVPFAVSVPLLPLVFLGFDDAPERVVARIEKSRLGNPVRYGGRILDGWPEKKFHVHAVLFTFLTFPFLAGTLILMGGLGLARWLPSPEPPPVPVRAYASAQQPNRAGAAPHVAAVTWRFTCRACRHSFAIVSECVAPELGCPNCGAPVATLRGR